MSETCIFVSHSKKDKEMITSFDHIFARTGVKSICMEFEKMTTPHWDDIKHNILLSNATFVLLGSNITCSIYTQNWVAFEVGISCSQDKDVWVFTTSASKTDFPIPYVTHYMVYKDIEDSNVFSYIRQIIEGYKDADCIFRNVNQLYTEIPKGRTIECTKCHAKFNFHAVESIPVIRCPLCLESIEVPKLKVSEKFNKYFK